MATDYATACRVVDAAGQAGGIDEVRRIAERGWPCRVDGVEPSPALLYEIRAEAQRRVSAWEAEEGTAGR